MVIKKKLIRVSRLHLLFLFTISILFLINHLCLASEGSLFPVKSGKQMMLKELQRPLRYKPQDSCFVIQNGNRRFGRGLYGWNTGFRVAAGDLPEFMLYGPGKLGTLKLGIIGNNQSKWLNNAENITMKYIPGKIIYEISDPLLGEGRLIITVMARYNADGLIMKLKSDNVNLNLFFLYGAVSGQHFSRNGDIGTEPIESFLLNPNECENNEYEITDNGFTCNYEAHEKKTKMVGQFPDNAQLKITDASNQTRPQTNWNSANSTIPALACKLEMTKDDRNYLSITRKGTSGSKNFKTLPEVYNYAEQSRKEIASQVHFDTPDKFMNPLGEALAIAADACWEEPTWLHGAIGWRARLPGWRVGYTGNVLGWYDRSRMHFRAYKKSQVTQDPKDYRVIATERSNLARAEHPKSLLYSKGYISTAPNGEMDFSHYDMNAVFVDALLWYLLYTGDMDYAREMWPVIRRHLAWEKRCFDPNDDGLYDAYAAIWASDALQYNGGDVTYSSAYHYRSNKLAARLATKLGYDSEKYSEEATKIKKALNESLWLTNKGWFAEYKDLMGNQKLHENPALWTIYHAIDKGVGNKFQDYQLLRYVDSEIPHLPVHGRGIAENLSIPSTSNWHPYSWSVNNVAISEVTHTALAYWKAGRNEKAFRLWKSVVLDFMYMGSCPGNYGQISYLDAARGETYSDFSDAIGICSRALMEGLYGIIPDALKGELKIEPGFPYEWNYAKLNNQNIGFEFTRNGNTDSYIIKPNFPKSMKLVLHLDAFKEQVAKITVNGEKVHYEKIEAVGKPEIKIEAPEIDSDYKVKIEWKGNQPLQTPAETIYVQNEEFEYNLNKAKIVKVHDPQNAVENLEVTNHTIRGKIVGLHGHRTIFVKVKQGDLSWWLPNEFEVRSPYKVLPANRQNEDGLRFKIQNNTDQILRGQLSIQTELGNHSTAIKISAGEKSNEILLPNKYCVPGKNALQISINDIKFTAQCKNWEIPLQSNILDKIDISPYFNDSLTNIYKHEYREPRPEQTTLQVPVHGYGDWTHYDEHPYIDDKGLREMAGDNNTITLPNNISFATPFSGDNIVYTSLWNNYPDQFDIPLEGKASHAYLLMTGSTYHMQAQFVNGKVIINYKDGTQAGLQLRNPDNWYSIERDHPLDDYAFEVNSYPPVRLELLTGEFYRPGKGRGVRQFIKGGAATILDIPLDKNKELASLHLKTTANEVIIGLLGLSLKR